VCSRHHIHCSGGGDKASRKWGFRADIKRRRQRCRRWGRRPGQAVLEYAVRPMAWCREAIRPHRYIGLAKYARHRSRQWARPLRRNPCGCGAEFERCCQQLRLSRMTRPTARKPIRSLGSVYHATRRVEEGRLAGTYRQPTVSLPRSSNWTCPFRTSSLPTGFTAAPTRAIHTYGSAGRRHRGLFASHCDTAGSKGLHCFERNGKRTDLKVSEPGALEFAPAAAAGFGVGNAWTATFSPDAVRQAAEKKEQDKTKKKEAGVLQGRRPAAGGEGVPFYRADETQRAGKCCRRAG
jgi:hypothetical protein